jgi:hypothetical protein
LGVGSRTVLDRKETYALEVYVGFAQSLGLDLPLRHQHTFDRLASLFGAQDIDLGDPPLDQAFAVKAHEPSAAGEILDPPTRAALLALHQRVGVVSLSDEGMSVRLPCGAPDPAVVPRTVQQPSALAESISSHGTRERELGPYRWTAPAAARGRASLLASRTNAS